MAPIAVVLVMTSCAQPGDVSGTVVGELACSDTSTTATGPCMPEPLAGVVLTIVRVTDSKVIGRLATNADGAFTLQLDAGEYRINGVAVRGFSLPSPVVFEVSPGTTTSVALRYAPAMH